MQQHLRALDVSHSAPHSVLLAPAQPGVQHAVPHHEPPARRARAWRRGWGGTLLRAETLRHHHVRPWRPLAVADATREQRGCGTWARCRARDDPGAALAGRDSGKEQAPSAVFAEQVRAGLNELLQAVTPKIAHAVTGASMVGSLEQCSSKGGGIWALTTDLWQRQAFEREVLL